MANVRLRHLFPPPDGERRHDTLPIAGAAPGFRSLSAYRITSLCGRAAGRGGFPAARAEPGREQLGGARAGRARALRLRLDRRPALPRRGYRGAGRGAALRAGLNGDGRADAERHRLRDAVRARVFVLGGSPIAPLLLFLLGAAVVGRRRRRARRDPGASTPAPTARAWRRRGAMLFFLARGRGPANAVTTPWRVRSSCSVHWARRKSERRLRTMLGRFSRSRRKPFWISSSSRWSKKRSNSACVAGRLCPTWSASAGVASAVLNHS